VDYLMRDFQKFWHLNSGIWLEKCDYPEAGLDGGLRPP
jgi:hypothetical protein